MGRKATPGLYRDKSSQIWHIDKTIRGFRIRESTGTRCLEEAERYLAKRISETRDALIYGQPLSHSFRESATKYLIENMHLKSINSTSSILDKLDPYIGDLDLSAINNSTFDVFKTEMLEKGRKGKTINNYLEVVSRVFKKAATVWYDESGNTWTSSVPYIEKINLKDKRDPYPISWLEQKFLFAELTDHLLEPSIFGVHTGLREQEICQLRWDWEFQVPELDTTVFVLPASVTKNEEERMVPLNRVARSVIEAQRGKHPSRVFTRWSGNKKKGTKKLVPLEKIYGHGWQGARERAAEKYEQETKDPAHWGFENLRVHDLRHTFGRRLRAAGVSKETRSDLLGHKTGDITSHYSTAEIKELIEAVEKIASNNLPEIYQTTLVRVVG